MTDSDSTQHIGYRTNIKALLARYSAPKGACVEWHGYKNQFGYGRACVTLTDGRHVLRAAHRMAYELHVGPIPRGKVLMHVCDNRACVRVEHLRVGTHLQNNADMTRKGRAHWQRDGQNVKPLAMVEWRSLSPLPDRLELPGHIWKRDP